MSYQVLVIKPGFDLFTSEVEMADYNIGDELNKEWLYLTNDVGLKDIESLVDDENIFYTNSPEVVDMVYRSLNDKLNIKSATYNKLVTELMVDCFKPHPIGEYSTITLAWGDNTNTGLTLFIRGFSGDLTTAIYTKVSDYRKLWCNGEVEFKYDMNELHRISKLIEVIRDNDIDEVHIHLDDVSLSLKMNGGA